MHVPPWQLDPAPHFAPHAPQLLLSVFRFASQPLAAFLSQFPKPVEHEETAQVPALQAGVPLAELQTFAQAPQLRASRW